MKELQPSIASLTIDEQEKVLAIIVKEYADRKKTKEAIALFDKAILFSITQSYMSTDTAKC